jgi:hypothetical protein
MADQGYKLRRDQVTGAGATDHVFGILGQERNGLFREGIKGFVAW